MVKTYAMIKRTVPYKNSLLGKKKQIIQMFNNISGDYDKLNRIISFGADVKWRKKIIQILEKHQPKIILDLATGTGDLAIMMNDLQPLQIKGLDISEGMLAVGKEKIKRLNLTNIEMILGDSEQIPFEDNYFDAATVAFGVRNFENLNKGLQEIIRILKPNGILVVLETSVPRNFPYKQGYALYSKYLLPYIGKIFSKDKKAYAYLSESAKNFPCGQRFMDILKQNGFVNVKALSQTFGVATIYTGKVRVQRW